MVLRLRAAGEIQTGEEERAEQDSRHKMQVLDIEVGAEPDHLTHVPRQRKLERIAQLDSEVAQLREEQEGLARLREELRREAGELRRQIQQHRESGCPGLGVI